MVSVISNATRPPEPVEQAAAGRIDELTQTRDEGIAAGVSHTFADDGRTGTVPAAVPGAGSRVAVIYQRAERAVRNGETKTFSLTTLDNQDHNLNQDEMVVLGDKAVDAGQEWFVQWQKHKQAIQAIVADTSLTDDEKRSQIAAYDDTSENGGWP